MAKTDENPPVVPLLDLPSRVDSDVYSNSHRNMNILTDYKNSDET